MSPPPGSVLFIVLIYPALTEALDRENLLYLSAETLTFSTCYFKITHCTCLWGPMWFFHTVKGYKQRQWLLCSTRWQTSPSERRSLVVPGRGLQSLPTLLSSFALTWKITGLPPRPDLDFLLKPPLPYLEDRN